MDLSVTVLQITASQIEAIASLRHPHNHQFLVSDNTSTRRATPKRRRENTPSVEPEQVQAVLRTDHYPFDPLLEWVFGRGDDEQCDFRLGTREQGVSARQFRIGHNWEAMTLVLTNLASKGTKCVDPSTGRLKRIMTSRAILPNEEYRIFAGAIDLTLRVPPRNDVQQARYEANLQVLKQEINQATPSIGGLRMRASQAVTPVIVGRKRRFVLQDQIGVGVTGSVHRAVDYETGDVFAAKTYNLDGSTNKVLKEMLNEIKILQGLDHKHIVKYIDIFRDPEPVLIMELALGSLEKHCIDSMKGCATMLAQVLDGLAYLHEQQITHRDIKPANILFTRQRPPVWKLTDFGYAKLGNVTKTICGSPMYLAPEVGTRSGGVYTNAVDLWSIGVVGAEYTNAIKDEYFAHLREGEKPSPPWYEAISTCARAGPLAPCLSSMLAIAPADRPSAKEMARQLGQWDTLSHSGATSEGST